MHSRHLIEDIIRWPACWSAEKAVFSFSNMCWSETSCLDSISKSTEVFFSSSSFWSSSYLILHNRVCLSGGKSSSNVCVRLRNSVPFVVLWLKIYAPLADVVWTHSVNVWPASHILPLVWAVWISVRERGGVKGVHCGKNLVIHLQIPHSLS